MSIFKKVMNIFSLTGYLAGQKISYSEMMQSAVSLWDSMYKDTGGLALASSIASETARMATLEMKSAISGSKRADFLNKPYQNVISDMRRLCELACAKGGIVIKPYVANGKIKLSYIQAENFIPCEYNASGKITGALFLDRYTDGDKFYTRIERHGFSGGIYKIRNSAFLSKHAGDLGKSVSLSSVEPWRGIAPYVAIKDLEKPLFAYLKMPLANNIDEDSPLGVSIFSRAVSQIRDAEAQYKRLLWEFESGERALYIDETAIKRDAHGNRVLPDKRLYRMLNSANDDLFEDWSPQIREQSIISGLNEMLRRIEFTVGLAYGTLSDVRYTDRTAEEFRASKQRSYTHICDIQLAIHDALCDLVCALDALCDLYSLCDSGKYSLSFDFDDSIAADRKTEFEEKMRLLEKGIINDWEMRAWYFGEEEGVAKSNIKPSIKKTEKRGSEYEKRRN